MFNAEKSGGPGDEATVAMLLATRASRSISQRRRAGFYEHPVHTNARLAVADLAVADLAVDVPLLPFIGDKDVTTQCTWPLVEVSPKSLTQYSLEPSD